MSPQVRKEQAKFTSGAISRVRPVYEVLSDLQREIAADRARGRRHRIGDSHEVANRLDSAMPLDAHRDERAAGDELDELAEERLALMLAVVLARRVAVQGPQLHR